MNTIEVSLFDLADARMDAYVEFVLAMRRAIAANDPELHRLAIAKSEEHKALALKEANLVLGLDHDGQERHRAHVKDLSRRVDVLLGLPST